MMSKPIGRRKFDAGNDLRVELRGLSAAEQRDELASFHCPLVPASRTRLSAAALPDFGPLYVC
jgi:hypothetical protein